MAGHDQDAALAELREDIDRIDKEMHELLMERGRIIDRLISVKGGTASTGSAFRPEREASMMRAMARRHAGGLPFDAVEGIWRIIISTFTHLQAPFAVQADLSSDAAATRDSARFHFGLVVPLVAQENAAAVVEAVSASRGDLGLVPVAASSSSPWWHALEPEEAPKVIARLPFVDRPDHPAPHPILVIAKSISGEGLGAVTLFSLREAENGTDGANLPGARQVARCGTNALIAAPRRIAAREVSRSFGATTAVVVGSHPSPDLT